MLSPIEMNGMLPRQQELGNLKQNQLTRPIIEHQEVQKNIEQRIIHDSHQVKEQDDTSKEQQKFDARDKGNNKYENLYGDKKKKKKEEKFNGIIERENGSIGFDIRL